jgi:hypothetical protein
MDIAALSSQAGEALRAQLATPVVGGQALAASAATAGNDRLSQAAIDFARLQARADALAGLAVGLRAVPGAEGLSHKLYPPYPPEQQAQMRMLAATVAGLRSVDAAIAGSDAGVPFETDLPVSQIAGLGLDTQKLLAGSPTLQGGISQNRDRLLAIAQASNAY